MAGESEQKDVYGPYGRLLGGLAVTGGYGAYSVLVLEEITIIGSLSFALSLAVVPAAIGLGAYALFSGNENQATMAQATDALGIAASPSGLFTVPISVFLSPDTDPLAFSKTVGPVGDLAADPEHFASWAAFGIAAKDWFESLNHYFDYVDQQLDRLAQATLDYLTSGEYYQYAGIGGSNIFGSEYYFPNYLDFVFLGWSLARDG